MFRVSNPPNRFDPVTVEWDEEEPPPKARLRIHEDDSRGVVAHNDSEDVGFDWSVNPYRGCTHACAYCYARPFHEFLGFGAGTDFEREIVVKRRAPELLEAFLRRPGWRGEHLAFSGVTDCYQTLERRYELTRRCLEVCVRFRNPVSVITRSPLVARDVDLLAQLAEHGAAAVTFSLPLPDRRLQQALEPGAPSPESRLQAMRVLADAGVPVGVSVAPIIPGVGDALVPRALQLAREAGARWAWPILLRLPGAVAPVFEERLREALPERADAVMAKVRRLRDGGLNDPRRGHRMKGRADDPQWQTIRGMFDLWHAKLGYGPVWTPPDPSPFRVPTAQLGLFG
ncbi:MAG: radical SAM protein [Alphaproteobacteria bacterium]|nr:radical SAM protein [Alphaproteobacteria bacterium]MCB9698305.1 radical SAM protein [Alphaproteobacteria bacterium]